MTIYTVHFYTDARWAADDIEADTPDLALKAARAVAETDDWRLDFQSYDGRGDIEHIQVMEPSGCPVAEWRDAGLLLRLAADDLLEALEQAVQALNTAPRFRVPQLDTDSYAIASLCDRAIANAKGKV